MVILRRKLLVGYLVFVHILLALILIKSDFLVKVGDRLGIRRNTEPEITQHFERMVKYHESIDPNVPAGSAIFIGDSIIQGLCVSAVSTPSINYGIGSDTTLGVLKRLSKYRSLQQASIVIFEIGVNDLKRRKDEDILCNYSSILSQLPSHLPAVVSGILPVNEAIAKDLKGYNLRITRLNAGLKALCEARKPKCSFVDSSQGLIDSDANLSAKYQRGDGVHLNGTGNAIWIQELKNAIKTAQQPHAPDRQ